MMDPTLEDAPPSSRRLEGRSPAKVQSDDHETDWASITAVAMTVALLGAVAFCLVRPDLVDGLPFLGKKRNHMSLIVHRILHGPMSLEGVARMRLTKHGNRNWGSASQTSTPGSKWSYLPRYVCNLYLATRLLRNRLWMVLDAGLMYPALTGTLPPGVWSRWPTLSSAVSFLGPEESSHDDTWAVIVQSSRYWFNYRHAANALMVYHELKRRCVTMRMAGFSVLFSDST